MKNTILIIVLLIGGLTNQSFAQLKMVTPYTPQVFYGSDSKSIVYEIHLMDSLKRPIEFIDFTVSSGKYILQYDSIYETIPKRKEKNRYLKYMWIETNQIPKVLTHLIKYKIGNEIYELKKEIAINNDSVISIGLPVQKGIWYMQAAPSPTSYHRATTIAFKTRYDSSQKGFILGHCNQRFAIDFAKVGENGLLYKNNGHSNFDHYCYEEDVIAVSNGIVVGVLDSIKEHEYPPKMDENLSFKNFTGNLVLLDIGNGIIASYAHLIPNSIIVNVGDTLVKGDLIGKIGNSGNSTASHLHFHLSRPDFNLVDSSDILGQFWSSEGVSYIFEEYIKYNVISGKYIEGELEYLSEPFVLDKPKVIYKVLPFEDDIIEIK